jgi:hypothetical protein
MQPIKKELKEALKLAIKGLIIQEFRVLQLEQAHCPGFIIDEMARSIEEAKRQIITLVGFMPLKERDALIKRLIRRSVDEEIDHAIQVRRTRCFRCVHVRYFDDTGTSYGVFPSIRDRARVMGCEVIRPASGMECRSFIENPLTISMGDYLDEMSIFYEVKEMFDQLEKIWEDYLTK